VNTHNWDAEQQHIVALLKSRLGTQASCTEVIDAYEGLMRSIWSFTARLLGDGGARAVLSRSISVAAREAPLVIRVRTRERDVDLSEFRHYVAEAGCGTTEVTQALIILGVMIFATLADLAGESITTPLIRHLEALDQESGKR